MGEGDRAFEEGRCDSAGLGHEIYKINLKYFVIIKAKETSKIIKNY